LLTLQQFPESGSPPSWQPQPPEQDQAPPPTAADQAPQTSASDQAASSSDRFGFDVGGWRITGWHAAVVIGAGLALFTLLQVWQYTSSTADVNAFDQAPFCYGHNVQPGCKTQGFMWLSVDSSSGNCYLAAHPLTTTYPYYSGEFSDGVCKGVRDGSHGFVEIWHEQLVHVTGLAGDDWSTNSAVGRQMSALHWIVIGLLADAGFALIAVLYFISWVVGRRRRTNPG
jgi:hypothetical protein